MKTVSLRLRRIALATGLVCAIAFVAHAIAQHDAFDAKNQVKADPFDMANQVRSADPASQPKQDAAKVTGEEVTFSSDPNDIASRIHFGVSVGAQEVRRGSTVRVTVTGTLAPGFHTYSMTKIAQGQIATSRLVVADVPGLRPLGPISETEPKMHEDVIGKVTEYSLQHETQFQWAFDLLVRPDAKPGPIEYPFKVDVLVCDSSCLPGTLALAAKFNVSGAEPLAVPQALADRAGQKFPPVPTEEKSPGAKLPAKDSPKVNFGTDPNDIASRIHFAVSASPQEARRGSTVRVTITGTLAPGFHTYSMTKTAPGQAAISRLKVADVPGLRPLGPISETEPSLHEDVIGGQSEFSFQHATEFQWSFDLLVQTDAKPGPAEYPFKADVLVCDSSCLPGAPVLSAKFNISSAEPLAVAQALADRAGQRFPPAPAEEKLSGVKLPAKDIPPAGPTSVAGMPTDYVPRDYQASMDRVQKWIKAPDAQPTEGLVAFMLAGMFWGFVSLITPCVFPMIPITVSFFLKQSEKEHHRPVAMALVYCGTIVLVLTVAAAALLAFFRALSISPVMNFGMGCLFIFFALSLFGMYDIELPSFLARFTSERESKGGFVGTIFMALTFTIISFACVAPFLGGFGGTAATGAGRPLWHTILGGLAFSVTFASPFFLLALFPTLLKAMPKSGSWLNSVKVVMGFLELAAAFKFLRAGELVLPSPPGLFTFNLVLSLWVVLCLLCGLYLLGIFRLPHDTAADHLSVPRMLFSILFISLGLYIAPGVLGSQFRPTGAIYAWVDAFLLTDPAPAAEESWSPNLENAIIRSREYRQRTGKPKYIFVDFTGETCTNCKLNENNVFPRPEIHDLFKPYTLVRLFCDTIPLKYYAPDQRGSAEANDKRSTDAQINQDFSRRVFNDGTLPLYVILEPQADGSVSVVGIYNKGKINSEADFADFLRKPLQSSGTLQAGL
jgi:thiol:disulfide interchange protein